MSFLLNLVYLSLLLVASPWLLYAAIRRGKYREGWSAKLLGQIPLRNGTRKCLWFHAVSVGEASLLQTVLPRIEATHADVQCVISVTTKTAYDFARTKFAPRTVFYCPLDFSWAVDQAIRRMRPDILVLVELELWPNLIRAAKRHGLQVALINGRLSEKSFRGYRRARRWTKSLVQSIDLIAVQSHQDGHRFLRLGACQESIYVTGSLKFDGCETNRENSQTRRLRLLAGIDPEDVVFLAGSTQHPEEAMALKTYQSLKGRYPQLRLVLVPRHPHRFDEVAQLLSDSGIRWQRRTSLRGDRSDYRCRVLLVDTIGELASWWGIAHVAFVGGSMGKRGGQNMIEPAAYGAAVSFGPQTHNFRDVVTMMTQQQAAQVVHDQNELDDFVRRCLEQPQWAARLGANAARLVRQQLGAADHTVRLLTCMLDETRQPRPIRDVA